jgi:glycosyltransferase involved in cell wall biosynthesis
MSLSLRGWNNTLKIVFLMRSLNYGGAERQLVNLSKGLHDRGYSILVAVFYPDGPLEMHLHNAGVPVYSLKKRGRWDMFGFLLRLIRFLRKEKPDILHSYLGVPNILTALLKPALSHTRVVWGVRGSNNDLSRYDWLSRVVFRLQCILSRFADLVIANSYAGKDYVIAHGFPGKKTVVIPNGINTELFYPDISARRQVRREWDITEDKKLIGLVGRLDPKKDHPTFLRAAALLMEERKDVRLACIGGGPAKYREELQAMGRKLGLAGILSWMDSIEYMPSVYNALDIISSSSSFGEGFPNVIGEAMACGVPCVVTDVGDSARIVGDTGIVVPQRDPHSLANGWKSLLDVPLEKRKHQGSKARKRILHHFGTTALVDNTIAAFECVLQRECQTGFKTSDL